MFPSDVVWLQVYCMSAALCFKTKAEYKIKKPDEENSSVMWKYQFCANFSFAVGIMLVAANSGKLLNSL